MTKDWMSNGFRTWKSGKPILFRFNPMENSHGDLCFRVTLHLLGTAFQFAMWYHLPWVRK